MTRFRLVPCVGLLSLIALTRTLNAQAAFKVCAASTQDQNLRLEGTFGFSASFVNSSSTYKLYATTFMNRLKWNTGQTAIDDILSSSICTPALSQPPTSWDPRCMIDSIALFSKTPGKRRFEQSLGWVSGKRKRGHGSIANSVAGMAPH